MKIVISGIVGLIIGALAVFLMMRNLTTRLDNHDVASFQVAEILKGNLVARGEDAQVIMMVRNLIEEGICKDSSLQHLYLAEETQGMVARQIEEFYFSLEEEVPPHVRDWLSKKEISYSGLNDCFTNKRMSLSEHGDSGILNVVAEFRNRSNETWKNVSAVGALRNKVKAEGGASFKNQEITGDVTPGQTISFSFDFKLQDKDWPEDVTADVNLFKGEWVKSD